MTHFLLSELFRYQLKLAMGILYVRYKYHSRQKRKATKSTGEYKRLSTFSSVTKSSSY